MEYKILSGIDTDIQKILNQWRHQYYLTVISMCVDYKGAVKILLTREKKNA